MATKINWELLLASILIISTVVLTAVAFFRWVNLGFSIGPYRFTHWVSWIGAIYIALAVPLIAIFKRRTPLKIKALLRIHVYGNLLAFMLISIHFASQVSRSPLPDLGTGLALYVVVLLLVATGFLQRFRIVPGIKPQTNRFIHVSLALSFYLIIGIHILHGVGII